jgi:hypothetical protein
MTHPIFHAQSSVRRFGGTVEDYQPIHDWLDVIWTVCKVKSGLICSVVFCRGSWLLGHFRPPPKEVWCRTHQKLWFT